MSVTTQSIVLDLNVGGTFYTVSKQTLCADSKSKLALWFKDSPEKYLQNVNGKYFLDRRGDTFSYILDYLRYLQTFSNDSLLEQSSVDSGPNPNIILPASAEKRAQLKVESDFYNLKGLSVELLRRKNNCPCSITLSYRGLLPSGRDSLADVQFRKIMRILVSGKSVVCREIFSSTLNESRAPDCGNDDDRYSSRYYLTHNTLEMAFDKLLEANFVLTGCCGGSSVAGSSQKSIKVATDCDEGRSFYFHEFYFVRT